MCVTNNPFVPVKKLISLIVCTIAVLTAAAQTGMNSVDAKKRKQGPWSEQIASVRGEPAYTWEGSYKNDRKEGIWKKYNANGDVIAEETFKNGVLDGLCKYYYPDGKPSATGNMLAVELEGQVDTVAVVDPVSGEETLTEVVRKGNSVKHGEWRVYDEDGSMVRETYERGELSTSAPGSRTRTAAPLPHEQQAPGARKKKSKE